MNDSYTPLFEFIFGGGIKANCDRIIQRYVFDLQN